MLPWNYVSCESEIHLLEEFPDYCTLPFQKSIFFSKLYAWETSYNKKYNNKL